MRGADSVKLNLGCGFNKKPGFVNVDVSAGCAPDLICDLETTPWPWETGTVEEVLFNHSLEHLGGEPKVFLAMMQELYRVCRAGAVIQVNVPHPRHDNFINDPTHVRAITTPLLRLFSKKQNQEWKRTNSANTPLALYLNVDFEITHIEQFLDEPYLSQLKAKAITTDQLNALVRERNNVVSEIHVTLKAVK